MYQYPLQMREPGGLCCGVDCLSFVCTAKPREQGNQVQLPGGFVVFLTLSLWEPLKEIFASLAQKVKQPQVVTKQNKLQPQPSQSRDHRESGLAKPRLSPGATREVLSPSGWLGRAGTGIPMDIVTSVLCRQGVPRHCTTHSNLRG